MTHLGLIGGIGPAATSHYYRLIVDASDDVRLTIDHAQIAALSANVASKSPDAQAELFADHIDRLRRAGATVAAVTSVAGHFCISELETRSSLPLISALDSLTSYFKDQGMERVGILGNRLSMRSHLFGMIDTVSFATPPEARLEQVGEAYMEMAKSGLCDDEKRRLFIEAGREMVADGADAVLLGGTDLFLAFEGHEVEFPVVDAAKVHVADILTQR